MLNEMPILAPKVSFLEELNLTLAAKLAPHSYRIHTNVKSSA